MPPNDGPARSAPARRRVSRRSDVFHTSQLINEIVPDEPDPFAANALQEGLGVNWKKTLPIPNVDTRQYPEVRALKDTEIDQVQYTFSLDGSRLSEVFKGSSPFNDGTTVRVEDKPAQGYPVPQARERPEEFVPGLSPELMQLAQEAAKMAPRA
jgi:Mn-containing catalase